MCVQVWVLSVRAGGGVVSIRASPVVVTGCGGLAEGGARWQGSTEGYCNRTDQLYEIK
jgi:hypothetical protein